MNDDQQQILDSVLRSGGDKFYVYTHSRASGEIFYVGKGVGDRARDFWGRSSHHKRIVAKDGTVNIGIRVFVVVDERHACAVERQLILAMRKAGLKLCNQDDGGSGRIGVKLTEEHKQRLRVVGMGHVVSEATREKLRVAHTGRKIPEHQRLLSIGRKQSQETIALRVKALTGQKRSEAQCQAQSERNKGRVFTDEHRQNLRDSHIGVKHDPATKQKRSDALKAAWSRRKQAVVEGA